MERQMQKPLKKNYLQDPDGPRLTSSTGPFGDVNQSSELILCLSASKQIKDLFAWKKYLNNKYM